jgi:hypothetical protein
LFIFLFTRLSAAEKGQEIFSSFGEAERAKKEAEKQLELKSGIYFSEG